MVGCSCGVIPVNWFHPQSNEQDVKLTNLFVIRIDA